MQGLVCLGRDGWWIAAVLLAVLLQEVADRRGLHDDPGAAAGERGRAALEDLDVPARVPQDQRGGQAADRAADHDGAQPKPPDPDRTVRRRPYNRSPVATLDAGDAGFRRRVASLVEWICGERPEQLRHMWFGMASTTFDAILSERSVIVRCNSNLGAFDATRANLEVLGGLGLPVPRILAAGAITDAGPPFVAKPARAQDFADVPLADPGNRLGYPAAGAGLGPGLNDSIVFARCFNELPSFPDIVGNGFFDVHILARLHCPN